MLTSARLAQDLGLDQVLGYSVSPQDASLSPLPKGAPSHQASPGQGPRGMQAHPTRPDIVYLISELDGSLTVLRMAAGGSGAMTAVQSGVKTYRPSDPGGAEGKWPDRWASALAVSPDGRFLSAPPFSPPAACGLADSGRRRVAGTRATAARPPASRTHTTAWYAQRLVSSKVVVEVKHSAAVGHRATPSRSSLSPPATARSAC